MFRSGKTPTKVFIQANASGFSLSLAHLTKHLPLPLLSPLSSSSSSFSTFFPFLLVLLDTVSPYSKFLPFFPPNLLLLWLLATSLSFCSFRLLHPPSLPSSSSFFPCAWLLKKTSDFVPKCVHWFMPNLKKLVFWMVRLVDGKDCQMLASYIPRPFGVSPPAVQHGARVSRYW